MKLENESKSDIGRVAAETGDPDRRADMQTASQLSSTRQHINLLPHALAYIRKGWKVIPLWWVDGSRCGCGRDCGSAGKHPHNKHGSAEPMGSATNVELYWSRHPRCNIGIVTGAVSGIVVLDIDPDKGGKQSMMRIFRRYGHPGDTLISVTGGGGRHVFFRHPGGTVKNSVGHMPGIDIRADGGLVVAPPSMHASGHRYYWHEDGHPRDKMLLDMPFWLMDIAERAQRRKKRRNGARSKYGRALNISSIETIGEGHRNDTLCSIAGRLIWENRDEGEILSMIQKINEQKCKPPLPGREVERLVHHAYRRWAGK